MTSQHMHWNEYELLHELKHYLPSQAPLKDFIHHNTLHVFQDKPFFEAIRNAAHIFGYKTSLSLSEYRELFSKGKINEKILEKVIKEQKGDDAIIEWKERLLHESGDETIIPRIGQLRRIWKKEYKLDIDSMIQPMLFRIICSYLDQGIAMWQFPVHEKGFIASLRELERVSAVSIFKTERAKEFLLSGTVQLKQLLEIIVGDESFYNQYLFDQQFAHPGWSGMVSVVEDMPGTLLDSKQISLKDFILFELLLELDALDSVFGPVWKPIGHFMGGQGENILADVPKTNQFDMIALWQQAYEWTYYDEVLSGIHAVNGKSSKLLHPVFQAMFCIDDRCCSIRRHIERLEPNAETFGTPGFFGVEFYYKPEHGKFITKLCPAPVTPRYLIKEADSSIKHETDYNMAKQSHGLFRGWLFSQTIGFWSAMKLFWNIFKPSMIPATATSFRHMDAFSKLTIVNNDVNHTEDGLQIGFTMEEMATRVQNLLKSIGMVNHIAPIVYVIGHGSSSVNNPHYAAYDCGACSGRPGSVNARVICYMANHKAVRAILEQRGIHIPAKTQFVGGLHDTTRDEMVFYDEDALNETNALLHRDNKKIFTEALYENAKERSRRFEVINSKKSALKIHERVKIRSVSLFEPRPELNHATNTLCIIGRRTLTGNLFLDRRSFLNSYDYRLDPDGTYLLNILKAAAPVCGGINLEYYFSRVDNQKLGAGTKLPHNVMGLIGVANGIDGDLRTGLPSQMIEVHDPLRLLTIVEQKPEMLHEVLKRSPETLEWFTQQWIHLIAVHPEDGSFWRFTGNGFVKYYHLTPEPVHAANWPELVTSIEDNSPVFIIN